MKANPSSVDRSWEYWGDVRLRELAAAVARLTEALAWEVRQPINVPQKPWTNEEIARYLRDRYGLRVDVKEGWADGCAD
jgi:hypothetical protein